MKGSCLCGEIEYETDQLDSAIVHCACNTCRKSQSAAFNTGATVNYDHFRWLKGRESLKSYESSPGKLRHFCSNCGSHLVAQRSDKQYYILRVATLDDDPGVKPMSLIWKSHEVPWLEYGAHIAAYEEWQSDSVM